MMTNMSSMSSFEYCMLNITFPNESEAKKLAKELVEKQLANFANVIPSMVTVYRETDTPSIENDSETLVMAKIRSKNAVSIMDFVIKNHPYNTAEIFTLPILHLGEPLQKNLKTNLKSPMPLAKP